MSYFKPSSSRPSFLPLGSIEFTFERSSPKLTHRTTQITETRVVQITETGAAFGPRKTTWFTENNASIEETFA